MNQSNLYATLSKAGCKILSFEDYPSNQGSWRTTFIKADKNCEISSNRYDGYMSFQFTSADLGTKKSVVNSLKFLTDEAELTAVITWLRSFQNHSNTNKNKVVRHELVSTQ